MTYRCNHCWETGHNRAICERKRAGLPPLPCPDPPPAPVEHRQVIVPNQKVDRAAVERLLREVPRQQTYQQIADRYGVSRARIHAIAAELGLTGTRRQPLVGATVPSAHLEPGFSPEGSDLRVLMPVRSAGGPTYLCECTCGRRVRARGWRLLAGEAKSCGHRKAVRGAESAKQRGEDTGGRLLSVVAAQPGISVTEASRRLGMSGPGTLLAVQRLQAEGRLVTVRPGGEAGRRVCLYVADLP